MLSKDEIRALVFKCNRIDWEPSLNGYAMVTEDDKYIFGHGIIVNVETKEFVKFDDDPELIKVVSEQYRILPVGIAAPKGICVQCGWSKENLKVCPHCGDVTYDDKEVEVLQLESLRPDNFGGIFDMETSLCYNIIGKASLGEIIIACLQLRRVAIQSSLSQYTSFQL